MVFQVIIYSPEKCFWKNAFWLKKKKKRKKLAESFLGKRGFGGGGQSLRLSSCLCLWLGFIFFSQASHPSMETGETLSLLSSQRIEEEDVTRSSLRLPTVWTLTTLPGKCTVACGSWFKEEQGKRLGWRLLKAHTCQQKPWLYGNIISCPFEAQLESVTPAPLATIKLVL